MSWKAPAIFTICCPKCGAPVRLRELTVRVVEYFDGGTLRVTVDPTQDVAHKCSPPSDGLQPIERFVKHGALDDLGSVPS